MDIRPPVITAVGIVKTLTFVLIGGTFWYMNTSSRSALCLLLADSALLLFFLVFFWRCLADCYKSAHEKRFADYKDRPVPIAPFFKKMIFPLSLTAATSLLAMFRGVDFAVIFLSDTIAIAFLIAAYQANEQGFILMNTGLYKTGTFRYRLWRIVFLSVYAVFSLLSLFAGR